MEAASWDTLKWSERMMERGRRRGLPLHRGRPVLSWSTATNRRKGHNG